MPSLLDFYGIYDLLCNSIENEREIFLFDKEKSLLSYEQLLVKYESLTSEFNDKAQRLEDVQSSFFRKESELEELKLVADNRKKVLGRLDYEIFSTTT